MKKFHIIADRETGECNAVYFDFETGRFSNVLGISYIMETGGNPVTDNDNGMPTLDELKAMAIDEIADANTDDESYIAELCEAWGIL